MNGRGAYPAPVCTSQAVPDQGMIRVYFVPCSEAPAISPA